MDVRLPDGTIIKNVPEGTTKAALVQRLQRNGMAVPAEWMDQAKPEPRPDPTEGMSGTQKFLAGVGKGMTDLGRGVAQLTGFMSQQEIDEAKKLDAPLMNTGAGTAGNVTGLIATGLPTMFAPGANTVTGAAVTGGVMGLLQPVATGESRTTNTLIGGAAGGGGVLAGRFLRGAYQGGKALIEPFTQGGREKIAGRVIQRFADDPSKIAAATSKPTITGAIPTLAEQTGDAGLARLQDGLRAADPQIGNQISQRLADNNAARVASLGRLAGDSAKMKAAEAARDAATKDLYTQATKAAYTVDDKLAELLDRPAVKQAMQRAQKLAENQGRKTTFKVEPGNPYGGLGIPDNNSRKITGQALQDLKMAMDEMLTDPASGFTGKAGATIKDLRGQLLGWMEDANPAFKAARTTYRDASKPINSMQIGEEVARRATSNTSDLAGNPRMQANALLGMLRDESGLIERATGRKGVGNSLADVMAPDDLNLLRSVASEADRAAAVATAGNGPGSATAQRLASQNILRQLVGPTGLPESWAESALANTVIGKPMNLLYGGVAEPKIQQALAQAVLDPDTARAVLLQAQRQNIQLPQNALQQLTAAAARLSIPAAGLVARDR